MAKLSTEKRNQLADSDFGIPEKRMYPLHDKAHVESAVKLFGHAETKYKKSLARKILSRAREYGMDTSGWKQVLTFAQEQVPPMSDGTSVGNTPPALMAPYYDEQDELLERVNDLDGAVDPFVFAKRIVSTIHDQVEKDSKPPTGNQNCQLCTWCAEAWYRNMQVLPRPVYSPRDPALEIKGETIVMNPIKKRFSSQREVVETVRGNIDSRWYVHVNWKDSTGGHEFLVINIKDYAYIMDAQAGLLKEIDETDSTNSYFRDINFDNSYMVRFDDKPFNTRLFNEMNDPTKVLPWNPELDVPYMKEQGMLGDMSDKWTMRPATEADLEFVYFSELETVGENKNDPKVQKYIREDAKKSLGHTQIIVAEDSDIGVYQAYATDYYGLREGKKDWWYLAHIYIKPEYRTLGIGSAIIKRDIAEHDKILLQVMKSNTRAKKLYESLGFVVDMENDHGGLVMRLDKSKPVQEGVVRNIRDMTLIPVKDFKYNKVYYGDPTNGGSIRKLDDKPLFVTPHAGIASIFVGRRNIFHKLSEMGYREVNLGYDEWASAPDQPLSDVHVYVRNAPNLKPFTIEFDGYLHTIDCSDLKNNIYRYPWMSDIEHEVLIAKVPEVKIDNVQKMHIRYHVRGIEGREPSNNVQESFMDEYAKRVNDKGDPVPDKCKCGGKISITLKGEPVYICESCGKYYGTVPCNIQETEQKSQSQIYHLVYDKMADDFIELPVRTFNDIFLACMKSDFDKIPKIPMTVKTSDDAGGSVFPDFIYDSAVPLFSKKLFNAMSKVGTDHMLQIPVTIEDDIDGTSGEYILGLPPRVNPTESGKYPIFKSSDLKDNHIYINDKMRDVLEKFKPVGMRWYPNKDIIQEGAFQDIKNGVHPYSDKLVFHVSPEKHADGQIWKPRVPDYLDPYNPEDTGFEDNTTPRICFSTSIEGALNGITVNLQRQSPDTFDKMYVYVPEKPWKEYKHKTNKELVKNKLVYDANVTREVWIMEPVRMKLYGVIRVDQIADAKRKSVVPTSKGQKDTRNYFTYKWHWVVKPKALEKSTKFDYSPERVIDDLCVDVKKFKYGLIKDGRLMTGNVSDADYNKYWVFHSGETVDQAGGGNCYDMVEYEAGYLEAFGVAYKKYFMNFTDTKNTKTLNTHTICVVPLDGKFVYIEQAFKRVVDEWGYERKKVFDKLTDIFEYVAEVSAECENQDLNYGVWDYTNEKIDYGTPIKNFMDWIMTKCKMVYDGEAFKSKPIKEGYYMDRFGNRFYTEAKKEEMLSDDMEDISIGDLNLEEDDEEKEETSSKSSGNDDEDDEINEETISIKDESIDDADDGEDDDPMGLPEYLRDRMSEDDLESYDQPDENLDADNVDLGQFGKDTSDVQNEYDPKEVTILMKLMASEADAMNEYMDGAKETNVDVLRRLYADIANEERFHMEQLLYAKCELTGEKYEPKDPEVKSEYEELLKMGMDEETAMQTAVDRCHIRGSMSEDDKDARLEIQADVETLESSILMFDALYNSTKMVMESKSSTPEDVDKAYNVFVEAVYSATAAETEKSPLATGNKWGPIKLLAETIKFLIRTLMTLLRKFVEFIKRIKNHSAEIRRFIKQNGLGAIFDAKAKFYFIDLNTPNYQYINRDVDFLLGLAVDTIDACSRSLNIRLTNAKFASIPRNPKLNIKNNPQRGAELLAGTQLIKSAFVIPKDEATQEMIANSFFGFNNYALPDGKSANTLNALRIKCDLWVNFMQYVDQYIELIGRLANDHNSVYFTNKKKYDIAVDVSETVVKTCKAMISALQSDINTIIKLDNAAMEKATAEKDKQLQSNDYRYRGARSRTYERNIRRPESEGKYSRFKDNKPDNTPIA